MASRDGDNSWFSPSLLNERMELPEEREEFRRLWLGFMTARATLAFMLLFLQSVLYLLGLNAVPWLILLCAAHFAATLMVRLNPQPQRMHTAFDRDWVVTVGFDLLLFAALNFSHASNINYTPLFALPVLQAAVLGSLMLALGTSAGITLLMLGHSAWQVLHGQSEAATTFFQAALTGAGSFVVALLSHQLAARLASEQLRARRSQLAMRIQQDVNELVIDTLTDGVLVVDLRGTVHAANPAARNLIQNDLRPLRRTPFNLADEPGWQKLAELALRALASSGDSLETDVGIQHSGQGPRRLHARTRLTTAQWSESEMLCVIFLQDLRELEARLRTEKLASMGRMSAAVAHEIRNPLAAIAQANALLAEDLSDPQQQRLAQLVQQNAQRLDRIVDDVLEIARTGRLSRNTPGASIDLNATATRIAQEWAQQTRSEDRLSLHPAAETLNVRFDAEHLRRVLINLLDNARRYASDQPQSLQVHVSADSQGHALLAVWSEAPPMEPSVEQHLFEPFFSSESRSSGLGLYICRELCESHGAAIGYHRAHRTARNTPLDGNEFFISMQRLTTS